MATSAGVTNNGGDFVQLDNMQNATDNDADGNAFSTLGQTNTTIFVEGTASIPYQAKSVTNQHGWAGMWNTGNNWDVSNTHLRVAVRSLDPFQVEGYANGGINIRIAQDQGGAGNYGEWEVGGQDTLRATVDGFLFLCIDTTRTYDRTAGTPTPASTDGVYGGGVMQSGSGQNTFFVDNICEGNKIQVYGGGVSTQGNSIELAAITAVREYGAFKDIGGVYYLLSGMDIGETGTASSYWLDEGKVWNFEGQNVSNTLYTVTFEGNATGTNSAIFGSGAGTGDDETGAGGNTFVATQAPFNFVCIDSNIAAEFYGCNFLNANTAGGTMRLEQANAKSVSSLFSLCDQITVHNDAVFKGNTVVNTLASAVEGAVNLEAGTYTGNTVDGALTGVIFVGTHTRTVRNNTYSNNTTAIRFDTAQTVTMDNETFIGSAGEGVPTEALQDNYPDTNRNTFSALNATRTDNGQSFTGNGGELTKCSFQLQRINSPTGNMVARLYAHTGTFGTSSLPTGAALDTSTTSLDVSTIGTAWELHDFVFAGKYELVNGTNYVISVDWADGDGTNDVRVGIDNTTPTHAGNGVQRVSSVWSALTSDRIFYVYETTFAGGGGSQIDIENADNATTADSYAEANQNATTALDAAPTAVGQSITGNGGVLSNVRWYLQKVASPTGNAFCKLYAHSGVFGTSSVPTGSALATSANVNVADIPTSLGLVQFEFEDEYTLVNLTNYVVSLEYTGDATNYLNVGTDTTTPTHSGNFSTFTSPTWTAVSGTDAPFYVSTGAILTINATNGANPSSKVNTGSPPGAVIIQNAVTVSVKTITAASVVIEDVRVRLVVDSDEIINGLTDVNGEISAAYNYAGDVAISGWCRKSTTSPLYKQGDVTGTITSAGFSVTVTMILDE